MNLSQQEVQNIAQQRIYDRVALFEKSFLKKFQDKSIQKFRILFIILTSLSVVLMAKDCKYQIKDILGELEYHAFYLSLASFIYCYYMNDRVKTNERRKQALILTEISVSLNIAVILMFFIFNPIIFGTAYIKEMDIYSSSAIFLSAFCTIFNFFLCDFVLLEQDWLAPCVYVILWIVVNFVFDLNGITNEMKYAAPAQQFMLTVFFLIANTSVYMVLAKGSQILKKKHEHEIKEDLKYTV